MLLLILHHLIFPSWYLRCALPRGFWGQLSALSLHCLLPWLFHLDARGLIMRERRLCLRGIFHSLKLFSEIFYLRIQSAHFWRELLLFFLNLIHLRLKRFRLWLLISEFLLELLSLGSERHEVCLEFLLHLYQGVIGLIWSSRASLLWVRPWRIDGD